MKFGNILHVQVDKFSQGTVYVKSQTPQIAQQAMASFSGRYYAGKLYHLIVIINQCVIVVYLFVLQLLSITGKQITTQLLPESTYHHKYPGALAATQPIRI